MIDTITSAPGRIVLGAAPVAALGETTNAIHNVGGQLVNIGGALLASVIIHLGLSLISYCKTKLINQNGNQITINTQKTTISQKTDSTVSGDPAAVGNPATVGDTATDPNIGQ